MAETRGSGHNRLKAAGSNPVRERNIFVTSDPACPWLREPGGMALSQDSVSLAVRRTDT